MTAPQQPQERRARRFDEAELLMEVEPVSRIRRCRRCPEMLVGPRARRTGICDDCVGRGGSPVIWLGLILVAIALGAVIALFMLATATPRSGSADLTRPALTGAPHVRATVEVDPEDLGHGGAPSPTTELGPVAAGERGWATYCAETATHCHGWDTRYVGAVQSFTYGDEPYGVQVCRVDRPTTCTHVVVVSHCACGDRHGEATVIDLSPPAFAELAPLSRGVVRVTVEGPIEVPTMTLPATDEED